MKRFIIWAAITHHLFVACLLLLSPSVASVSSVHLLTKLFGIYPLIFILIFSSVTALVGLINQKYKFWFLIQQAILCITMIGAFIVIYNSAYSDGVIRSREFIAADQSIYIVMFVWHTIALLDWYKVIDFGAKRETLGVVK